jgi:hypothetical protein
MRASSPLVVLGLAWWPSAGFASDRDFTYTHQTNVLAKGDVELEPWTTFRIGKPDGFFGIDQRFELEFGLGNNVQTSWYVNVSTERAGEGDGVYTNTSSFDGISWELKGKLSDAVADALGSGLYLELTAGPNEVEGEGKILLEKEAGWFVGALNLVSENEVVFEGSDLHPEIKLEGDLALGGRVSDHVTLGVEIRELNLFESEGDGEPIALQHAALFAGPTIAARAEQWWTALTVLPQVARLGGSATGPLDLEEYENVAFRVLMGVHL